MNKDVYILQVFFDNQQSAIVAGELIAKELGIVVDILHRREILTIHPPTLPIVEEKEILPGQRLWPKDAL